MELLNELKNEVSEHKLQIKKMKRIQKFLQIPTIVLLITGALVFLITYWSILGVIILVLSCMYGIFTALIQSSRINVEKKELKVQETKYQEISIELMKTTGLPQQTVIKQESVEYTKCRYCGYDTPVQFKKCSHCGAVL